MQPATRRECLTLLAALAGVACFWAVWAGRSPLLFDEAYYWDWSRRLDLGYWDHPPLVAWIIRLTTWSGDGAFSVRAGMVSCGVGVVALAYWAGRLLGGPLAGWLSLALAATCPLFGLLFSFAGPDAPLLLCWAGAVCAVLCAVSGGSPRWWYAAGLCAGLALLAKYVAVLLLPSVALFVLLSPGGWLRRREPFLAGLAALLVWSPNLWWNARHGWSSVRFQIDHGACVTSARSVNYAMQALLYVENQITLVGPLLALALVAGTVAALRVGLPGWQILGRIAFGNSTPDQSSHARERDGMLLLACCTLVITVVFFLAHGVRHWAAPGVFSGIVCAALYLARLLRGLSHRRRVLIAVAVALICLAGSAEWVGLQLAYGERSASAGEGGWLIDLAVRVDAALVRPVPRWQMAAALVNRVLDGLPPEQRRAAVLVADGYGTAAELAYSMPGHPVVLSGSNQYALWPVPSTVRGPVLFVRDTVLAAELAPLPPGGRVVASQVVRGDGAAVGRVSVILFPRPDTARVVSALLALSAAAPMRCQ